jgi:membrane protein YqaA with SNARE-associated domain
MTSIAENGSRPGLVRRCYDWVLSLAERRHSTAWLALLSFCEASFFPLPPDIMLIPLCLGSTRKALRFAAICSLASVAGGIAGYGIGHFVWQQVDQFFFQVVPGFDEQKFGKFQALYEEWGVAVVFLAGFSPIPFKVFTIASGVAGMSFLPFVLASAVSRSARFFLVAGLLARYGEPMKVLIDRHFNKLALGFSVLLVAGFACVKFLL